MNKITEYFKTKKEQKKIQKEENEFVRDLYVADELSSNFNLEINYLVNYSNDIKEATKKYIERHNVEICFVPTIWNMLNRSKKIACMMELSKKYCKMPLTYENFTFDKNQKDLFFYQDKNIVFNCCLLDKLQSVEIMFAILDSENNFNHIQMMKKVEKYNKLDDFKNFDEIKYFNLCFIDEIPELHQISVLLTSPIENTIKKVKDDILNMFYNIKTFNKEFEPFYDELNRQIGNKKTTQEKLIKYYSGSTKQEQDEKNLRIFFNLIKTKFNDKSSFYDIKQKFLQQETKEM